VIPTGYSFNLDGFSIYLNLAIVFIANATGTPLSMTDLLTILQENRTRAPSEHGSDLYSVPRWFQGLIVVVIPVSPVRRQSRPGIFEITSHSSSVDRSRSDQLVVEGGA
jgi:Na+/H+ antiporter NhaD/arsenite permease-like protein